MKEFAEGEWIEIRPAEPDTGIIHYQLSILKGGPCRAKSKEDSPAAVCGLPGDEG